MKRKMETHKFNYEVVDGNEALTAVINREFGMLSLGVASSNSMEVQGYPVSLPAHSHRAGTWTSNKK
jgi:hypothetical protein